MPVQVSAGAYYVFVAAVFFLYWATAGSRYARLAVVLLANYLFAARYGLFYVVLLPLCSSIDFLLGLGLMRVRAAAVRRLLVGISVALNLGVLVGSRHMGWMLGRFGGGAAHWDWVFPLGLSFYAFQALTYTIDLYRRDAEGTHSLLEYLASVTFFPTLLAGPITRVADLLAQFTKRPMLDASDGGRAFFLIGLGLIKKTFLANFLAENLVNRVFDTPTLYSGAETLIAVYAYSLELYFDFSGYTDMARGVGMLLGIRLPINFDRPYVATNLTDFWRRWHLTFSNWLRDYLYFSLPGVRTKIMPYVNLIITMALGGLWHGITWTFFTWGLLHGTGLAATRAWMSQRGRKRKPANPWARAAAIFGTYQFVCLTWIFFRASSMENAFAILGRIGSLSVGFENISLTLVAALLVGAAAFAVRKQWYAWAEDRFARSPFWVHTAALLAVTLAVRLLGGRGNVPFVYSRF
jgi:D-alanyl-lipoteichoic acid acyltransferase DltB (MBOAT superfamily)